MVLLELWKPPPGKLNTYFILGEIVFNVNQLSDEHPNIDTDMLRALADGIRVDHVETEDALRALCQIFRDTWSYDFSINQLASKPKGQLSAFVEGKSAAEVSLSGFDTSTQLGAHHSQVIYHQHEIKAHKLEAAARKLIGKAMAKFGNHPVIYEDIEGTKVMEVYANVPFTNWALNIKARPSYTCVPSTVLGIQNLVKTFKDRRIRCSGYRHSRAPIFADDGDVLVSLLPLKQVTSLPDPNALLPDPKAESYSELRTVQVFPVATDANKTHVRTGAAVTAEELRHWAVKDGWALPTDVTLDEITIGGLNGSISRRSGYLHKTINDQVKIVEYVDVNGNLQSLSSEDELAAAAGCFGLLGIITHITYEVDKMTYAVMRPRKVPTMLAVPPLQHSEVPEALQIEVSDERLHAAIVEFEKRAETCDYAEWSWFPYQSDVFVNTWNSEPDKENVIQCITPERRFLQWLSGWLGGVISSTDFYADVPARWQTQLLATAQMAVFSPTTTDPQDLTIKTAVPDAHHFRTDYQYLRVRGMELEIPIPSLATDPESPDWTVVRKIWWEMIHLVYSTAASPMRLTLEMRIMADSNIIMAPQRGNTLGTVAIEVGTLPDVINDEEWQPLCQQVYDKLKAYAPEGRVRPHWGKEWYHLRMNDMPAPQYLRTVSYKSEIAEFKETLQNIGKQQGWELKDLQQRFSNRLWDEIVFDE